MLGGDPLDEPTDRLTHSQLAPFPPRYGVGRHAHCFRKLNLCPTELRAQSSEIFSFHYTCRIVKATHRVKRRSVERSA